MPATLRTPKATWVDAASAALVEGGPDAIRVEPLAKALGVTRGGFYWHFDDRRALLDAVLDAWEQRAVDDVVARVAAGDGDARAKVVRAGALTFAADLLPLDLAVRAWAQRDAAVGDRLRRVDDRRMALLRELIGAFVADPDDVEARALLAFSLVIGTHFVAAGHGDRTRDEVLERAIAHVLRGDGQ